jgi:lysophospholipase L1-like esterase
VNTKLHEAVLGLNCASLRETGNTGLSFISLDPVLGPEMFGGDGVHLNAKGDASLAQRLIRWIGPSSKYLRMKKIKNPNDEQM